MRNHHVHEEKPTDVIIQEDCLRCDRRTNHKVLSNWVHSIDDGSSQISSRENFQIIQCQGCDGLSFRSAYTCSEDIVTDPETLESFEDETINLYPSRALGKLRIQPGDIVYLTGYVRRALEETHDAICMGNNILSCAGIRLILETVCRDQEWTGDDLYKKIQILKEEKIINEEYSKILHKLRDLGNRSLHDKKIPSMEEINAAFTIVQHFLESIYIIPKKSDLILKKQHKKD